MYLIECWIERPVRSLDQTYTYLSRNEVQSGCRVLVPFGPKQLMGFVESCKYTDKTSEQLKQENGFEIKEIIEVIDEEPFINEELHDLAFYMKDITLSTTISCFQAMLPSIIKPQGKLKKIQEEKWVKLSDEEVSLTPKQLEVYQYVQQKGEVKYSELRKLYGNHAHNLVEKNAFILYSKEKSGNTLNNESTSKPLPLLPTQQKAMDEIENSNDSIYLINGVTGSGKTEVYLQLAQKQIEQGKQVLILVPEIALTPQMIERVSSRFQNALAIYHSALNPQQKYEQFKLVRSGEARIVVGTRSSVFLPFQDLGLIIMDEEHDGSYKQDNQPCYHARDIAIHRGQFHHCKVILGSATPSIDSYARALKHVYHLVEMKERINHTLPRITVVETQKTMRQGESAILSDLLKQKMSEQLSKNKQVILLLNRRGFHTQLKCKSCGEIIRCPHCDLTMSYHRDIKKMKCHTCGSELNVPRICPHCHSNSGFTTFGFGTERLEEEVHLAFPNEKILRMDRDTTGKKDSHSKILKAFGNHEASILVGTQMIAKGLDYPDVTLVGIINGDEGLNRTDFRSCEVTFDLLMQASGRSGRSEDAGEVILQVFSKDHYTIDCLLKQDYVSFFNKEMLFRRAGQYPPYTYLISITVSGKIQTKVDNEAIKIKQSLQGDFKVIGVISLLKIKDKYRNRIILKGKNLDEMRTALKDLLETNQINTDSVSIDVNPLTLD